MKMFIDGEHASALDGGTIEVYNPANGELLDTVPSATALDVERCLASANEGRVLWAKVPLYERCAVLNRFCDSVTAQREELALLQCREMGKPINQCREEIASLADIVRGYAERAAHMYEVIMPENSAGLEKDLIFTQREPLGVVVCIIPFNYPAYIFAHKVGPAVAMGNAVILKPASSNPLLLLRLIELLAESGMPRGAIQSITGSGSALGRLLIDNDKINAVAFTGSTEVGREIAETAARRLHRVMLELGGNDPFIVFEDANLDAGSMEAWIGRLINAGQVCCGSKRFIVQKTVKDEFVRQLLEKLGFAKMGDPADETNHIGCLIDERAAADCERKVAHTVEQGARLLLGGRRTGGAFFPPTVLDGVTPDMDIARDMEIFGPVFPIIEFDTEDEAVAIANGSVYGLSGTIFTEDMKKALRVAKRVQSGTLVINGAGLYRHKDHAFGGYKQSGYGREGISVTLEELSQVKTYLVRGVWE